MTLGSERERKTVRVVATGTALTIGSEVPGFGW